MKNSYKKTGLLTTLLTAGAMLIPKISSSLDGIVMNSITNEGIPDAIVKLYQGETLLDSARTDEEGYYKLSPNSVALEFNLPDNRSSEIKVFDIHGRFMYNLDQSWNGTTIPKLPSGSYIFQTPAQAFISPVIEGSLLSPIRRRLTERVKTGKNVSRTSNADETYTLSVSDDGIQDEIGDYYDASIPIDSLNATRDVELIPFYEMNDWDGDFLEYLKNTHETATLIWGDYPDYYPIHVDVDSLNAQEHLGDRTQSVLGDIRDALDLWNTKSNLEIFNYTNVNRDNRQVTVNYIDEGIPRFEFDFERDEDGRYRIESGDIYLRSDLLGGEYGREMTEHEIGHIPGWNEHAPNEESVMRPSIILPYVTITEDDAYVQTTITTLPNRTYWDTYLKE